MLESIQKVAILYDASQAVLSTFDLDEVLNRILSIIRDYFQLQNGAVMLLDKSKQELYVRAHFGRNTEDMGFRVAVGQGLTGTAAKLKRPIYAPDVSKDPRYINAIQEIKSEVAIPLMVRDEVVGVLDFESDQLDYFKPEIIDQTGWDRTGGMAVAELANRRLQPLGHVSGDGSSVSAVSSTVKDPMVGRAASVLPPSALSD